MIHLTFDPARGYGQKGCNMRIRREYNPKTIGRNLRRLRVRAGYSADEVREYLCLGSVQAVYKQERGESYPQADTLMALLELYEADFKDITREFEEDDKSSSFLCDKRMPSAASELAGRGLSERSLSGLRTRDDPSNRVGVSLLLQ